MFGRRIRRPIWGISVSIWDSRRRNPRLQTPHCRSLTGNYQTSCHTAHTNLDHAVYPANHSLTLLRFTTTTSSSPPPPPRPNFNRPSKSITTYHLPLSLNSVNCDQIDITSIRLTWLHSLFFLFLYYSIHFNMSTRSVNPEPSSPHPAYLLPHPTTDPKK